MKLSSAHLDQRPPPIRTVVRAELRRVIRLVGGRVVDAEVKDLSVRDVWMDGPCRHVVLEVSTRRRVGLQCLDCTPPTENERMKRLADEWASYREMAVPAQAREAQVLDTRRAFYAGALALATLIMDQMTPGPDVTEQDDAAVVAVLDELREFSEGIVRGAA